MVARSLLARSSLVGRFATRHPDLTTSQHLTTVPTLPKVLNIYKKCNVNTLYRYYVYKISLSLQPISNTKNNNKMKAPLYMCRTARYALGMTMAEAARAIGISYGTLEKAERGKEIRPTSWLKIVAFYRLDKLPEYDEKVISANQG